MKTLPLNFLHLAYLKVPRKAMRAWRQGNFELDSMLGIGIVIRCEIAFEILEF